MSDNQILPGPLAGLRILELADETGQFCGKLLGDLGADVVKIEPPGGEPGRYVGPFLDDIPHPERSLSFWHYNTSKRGITLNLQTADGRQLFERLAATSDGVFIACKPLSVARTTLYGLVEPTIFASTFVIPMTSKIARIGPPAMMPVPSDAGCI